MPEPEFDAATAARKILRSTLVGSLGTLDEEGAPFVSLITIATDQEASVLCLISRLAVHTRNLDRDGRASLLLVAPGGESGDPLAGGRITLTGRFERLDEASRAAAMGAFLSRHPEAEGYATFTDFGLFRMRPGQAHLVAGFGRITRVPGDRLAVSAAVANDFSEAQEALLAEINAASAAVLRAAVIRQLGLPDGPWSAVSVDADGVDLRQNGLVRLPFAGRLPGASEVLPALRKLGSGID
ncbi:HugZ family pyridoxamine 5'-phosphate oxidase [Oryzibacter oryziterrae]|uniref:HugZ family pyridoxamine 5'-phosphate oxidase n=1 Tax=Oryzibacter oryziterrae TaxID=2766474 RepID=UPI001F44C9C2|nr:CREG family protein [Oryzibacter oryziterrae]